MSEKFSNSHQILYYECDTCKNITLPMLANIAIQTSELQCEELEVGTNVVNSLGIGWVITQYEIEITRLPKLDEKITITTEATKYNKYFCYRDFWFHDGDGNECVVIHSTFVMMDLKTRKMVSIVPELIAPFHSEKTTKIERSLKFEQVEFEHKQEYRVRFSDIDGNRHVNNSHYFEWMTDVLGYDFLTNHVPNYILIKFEKEIEYGQLITSYWTLSEDKDTQSQHLIKADGVNCAQALIRWRK